jgi:CubicO group peptidase (beta-lactamase class C family)
MRAWAIALVVALSVVLPLCCAETKPAEPPAAGPAPAEAAPATPDARIAAPIEGVVKGQEPKGPWRWSLEKRMAERSVSALSIAIIDGGRVVWAQGFGVKEVGGHDPVTATTLFQAASCSKPVAASAMLRLVDKGTLSLDTNVNRYLMSWKLPENEFTKKEPVTLRRLATHTGGTTVAGFRGYKVGMRRPTVPELLDGKAPANNEPVRVDTLPGQRFRYSGGGYTIMQQLLIDVTGTPFPTLLQQQVFGPLGMAHSTFEQPLPEARAADAARGHEKNVVVPYGWHVYPELAAAGLWTTPTDLATWAIAMADALAGRSTKFLSQATASQIIASARENVGLGLFLSGTGDGLCFSHNGQNEGFLNEFKMFVNTGQGAAIMINTGEAGYGLIKEIQNAIAAEYGWPVAGPAKAK